MSSHARDESAASGRDVQFQICKSAGHSFASRFAVVNLESVSTGQGNEMDAGLRSGQGPAAHPDGVSLP